MSTMTRRSKSSRTSSTATSKLQPPSDNNVLIGSKVRKVMFVICRKTKKETLGYYYALISFVLSS